MCKTLIILWLFAIQGLSILCSGCGEEDNNCTPLSEMTANAGNDCPSTWEQAKVQAPLVCDEAGDLFSTTLSTSPCESYLRYTSYLFDAGPRYCLYDPTTFALVGYGISDPKAMYEEYSCGIDQELFSPDACTSTAQNACPAADEK